MEEELKRQQRLSEEARIQADEVIHQQKERAMQAEARVDRLSAEVSLWEKRLQEHDAEFDKLQSIFGTELELIEESIRNSIGKLPRNVHFGAADGETPNAHDGVGEQNDVVLQDHTQVDLEAEQRERLGSFRLDRHLEKRFVTLAFLSNALQERVYSCIDKIGALERQVQRKDQELEENGLRSKVLERDLTDAVLREQSLKATIKGKVDIINNLSDEVEQLESELSSVAAELSAAKEDIQCLTSNTREFEAEIERYALECTRERQQRRAMEDLFAALVQQTTDSVQHSTQQAELGMQRLRNAVESSGLSRNLPEHLVDRLNGLASNSKAEASCSEILSSNPSLCAQNKDERTPRENMTATVSQSRGRERRMTETDTAGIGFQGVVRSILRSIFNKRNQGLLLAAVLVLVGLTGKKTVQKRRARVRA